MENACRMPDVYLYYYFYNREVSIYGHSFYLWIYVHKWKLTYYRNDVYRWSYVHNRELP